MNLNFSANYRLVFAETVTCVALWYLVMSISLHDLLFTLDVVKYSKQ